eukprot:TRINITY_DN50476_c0_g1_i1.p1 TRINITY_DN50476_c0_g1~~TRINITY_DN50476_c0_g1_i1.p1  ORF type:complete len:514 (+),score=165.59 TRINITY_DN50476_c0_g1_i1:68-1609(+)
MLGFAAARRHALAAQRALEQQRRAQGQSSEAPRLGSRRRTAVPMKRMVLMADRPDMIPGKGGRDTLKGRGGLHTRRYLSRMKNRSMSILDPQTTYRPTKKPRLELTPGEQEFVGTAHRELADAGLGAEERFKAWLNQDHTQFPAKVADLDPHVRKAVKFGGLGLTNEAENLKERYLIARRQERDVQRQLEKEQEEAEQTGRPVRETAARRANRLRQHKLSAALETLKSKRQEIVGAVIRSRKDSSATAVDNSTVREALTMSAADVYARQQAAALQKRDAQLRQDLMNEERKAEGLSPIQTIIPTKNGVDISIKVAEVARAVMAKVRTDGVWPITIPAAHKPLFLQLSRQKEKATFRGMSRKQAFLIKRRVRRQEAFQSGKEALHAWRKGDEYGGAKDAREWREKHPWEWKEGSEPRTWKPVDLQSPWTATVADGVKTEAQAKALYTLATTKQTADQPLSDFFALHGKLRKRLNMRYGTDGKPNKLYHAKRLRFTQSGKVGSSVAHTANAARGS